MIRNHDFKFCFPNFYSYKVCPSLKKGHYSKNHNSSHPCLTSETDFQTLPSLRKGNMLFPGRGPQLNVPAVLFLFRMKDSSWALRFGRRICSSAPHSPFASVHKGTGCWMASGQHDTALPRTHCTPLMPPSLLPLFKYCG